MYVDFTYRTVPWKKRNWRDGGISNRPWGIELNGMESNGTGWSRIVGFEYTMLCALWWYLVRTVNVNCRDGGGDVVDVWKMDLMLL